MTGDFRSVTCEKPAVTQDGKVERFANCADGPSPTTEFQHQIRLVSAGAALRFSLFAGLLSVFVTPALVLLSWVTTIRIWLSPEGSNKLSLFGWNSLGLLVGGIAEVVFVAARNSKPY